MTASSGYQETGFPAIPARASEQDGHYPRPQLLRPQWRDLSGTWTFAFDPQATGESQKWHLSRGFPGRITVPFPWESSASGVGDTSFQRIGWYQRTLDEAHFAGLHESGSPTASMRTVLHFGAVDYACTVWINGFMVGRHEGGHTPFCFDITEHVEVLPASLVIRVEDDPQDLAQPRGKQDWQSSPHGIWYRRTSGIWQTVWLEQVSSRHITDIQWRPHADLTGAQVELTLSASVPTGSRVNITLWHRGEELAQVSSGVVGSEVSVPVRLNRSGFDLEALWWTPDSPTLIDARIELDSPGGADVVESYFGLRSVALSRDSLLLNGRPLRVLGALSQGYWPGSHLAAPSAHALRREVELALELGFNTLRLHQKFEDPRLFHWADRLGLMLWAESPAPYVFTPHSRRRLLTEWLCAVRRDGSHPSVVAFVPFNESWGIPEVVRDPAQQEFVRALVSLTRTEVPGIPVVANDGWELVDPELVGIHDYDHSPERLRQRYASREVILGTTFTAAGRRLLAQGSHAQVDAPLIVTEFGGVSYAPARPKGAWGYSTAESAEDLVTRVAGLFGALHTSPALAGVVYTQLADTLQETNGLLYADRTPKAPIADLRRAIRGEVESS